MFHMGQVGNYLSLFSVTPQLFIVFILCHMVCQAPAKGDAELGHTVNDFPVRLSLP